MFKLSDNLSMKSKQPRPLSREARWRKKVKTWTNMSSRTTDTSSDTSSDTTSSDTTSCEEEESEVSEASGGQSKTWQEDDEKPNQEELGKALDAGSGAQREEDNIAPVLISKIGNTAASLSSDSSRKGGYYSMQGELQDGRVVSASSSRGISHAGFEKPHQRKSFDCTVCGAQHFSVLEILEHPDLGVGICGACYSFLFSSPYTKDLNDCSEEQCRWCGQGGRIVMCDRCDKSFCESCIVRNYGPKALSQILTGSDWSCFCCDRDLLRAPIDELKEFQNSARKVSVTNKFPSKRRCAPCVGQLKTRDASEDSILGTKSDGATIAELIAQEEERRKLIWTNSGRVMSTTAPLASRKPKKATTTTRHWFHPALHTKVRRPAAAAATTAVKPEPWVAIDGPAPAPAASEVKKKPPPPWVLAPADEQAPASATTEIRQLQAVVVGKQAPDLATPPATRTWIRPHQWEQKRKEAAERRRRAAEAESLKNVSDGDPKLTNSGNPSGNLHHNGRCK